MRLPHLRQQHRLRQLRQLRQLHQLLALHQVAVQFLLLQVAVAQFRLRQVARVALVTRVQVVLLLRDQLVQQLVDQVAVQVHAQVVCLELRLVVVRSELVDQCVLRPQVVLVRVVQVLVRVVRVVVLRLVVVLVRVVQALVQALVLVVLALAALVVLVAVVLVVRVGDNAVLLKRNHVLVVVKTSTKCCRKLQRVTPQVMQQFLRASSLSSVDRLRKSLLQN